MSPSWRLGPKISLVCKITLAEWPHEASHELINLIPRAEKLMRNCWQNDVDKWKHLPIALSYLHLFFNEKIIIIKFKCCRVSLIFGCFWWQIQTSYIIAWLRQRVLRLASAVGAGNTFTWFLFVSEIIFSWKKYCFITAS